MKRITFVLTAVAFGVLLLSGLALAQGKINTRKPATAGKEIHKQKVMYVCPMDPEVQSDKPGKCPKCKMALEKKVIKTDAQSKIVKEMYTCPMDPDVKSDKPGKCPKCKMNLVKKTIMKETKPTTEAVVYSCPMHPDVKSDHPGKCPECGMNLEKVKK